MKNLIDSIMEDRIVETSKFFDLIYSHSVNDDTLLSFGEQDMLNLYSRIYDAVKIKPNKNNKDEIPNLIILDEAENGYHPEWQWQFINNIVKFLELLGKEKNFFQVIVTTHSPIILSDIPKSCTNYIIKKDKNKNDNIDNKNLSDLPETFGANVFDLYRNSFFMDQGLIGQFATNKINEVLQSIKYLKDKDHLERNKEKKDKKQRNTKNSKSNLSLQDIKKIIDSIGDSRIQNYLYDRLSEVDNQSAIDFYTKKLNELTKKNNYEQN